MLNPYDHVETLREYYETQGRIWAAEEKEWIRQQQEERFLPEEYQRPTVEPER